MRDLIQPALTARPVNARTERGAGRGTEQAERGFSEALQIKSTKPSAEADELGRSAAMPLAQAWRIKLGEQGFASSPSADAAPRQDLLPSVAIEQGGDNQKAEPFAEATVEPRETRIGLPQLPVVDDVATLDDGMSPEDDDPEGLLDGEQKAAESEATLAALVAMPAVRAEHAARPARALASAAQPVLEETAAPVPAQTAEPVEAEAAKPVPATVTAPVRATVTAPVPTTAAEPVEVEAAKPVEVEDGVTVVRADIAQTAKQPVFTSSPIVMAKDVLQVPEQKSSKSADVSSKIYNGTTTGKYSAVLSEPVPSRITAAVTAFGKPAESVRAETGMTIASAPAQPSHHMAGERTDAMRMPENAHVVAMQNLPAPAQTPTPAAAIAGAVAAAPDWMSLARGAAVQPTAASPSGAAPLKSLTIQLHPAELGSVTAKLQFAGEQLSIELQVENAEAYEKLAGDRDAIIKAVRALGIEVDRVTVQQPNASASTNPRADNATAFNGGTGRETGSSMAGSSGGRDGSGGNAQAGRNAGDEAHAGAQGVAQGTRSGDGRGLYI